MRTVVQSLGHSSHTELSTQEVNEMPQRNAQSYKYKTSRKRQRQQQKTTPVSISDRRSQAQAQTEESSSIKLKLNGCIDTIALKECTNKDHESCAPCAQCTILQRNPTPSSVPRPKSSNWLWPQNLYQLCKEMPMGQLCNKELN